MQRPDKDIIRRILNKAKKDTLSRPDFFKNTKKNVEVALTLPLISLRDHCFNSSPICNWYYDDFLTQGERDHEVAEPVFDEFVFHYKDKIQFAMEDYLAETIIWASFSDVDKDTYDYDADEPPDDMDVEEYEERVFKNCRIKFLTIYFSFPTENVGLCMWQGFVGFKVDKYAQLNPTSTQTIHCQATEETQECWGDKLSGIDVLAAGVFERAQILWLYAKYGDKHIVEVVPTKPKASKKISLHKNRPWLMASGPHILFLDRMPATQKQNKGTGTHASPKPHRRRGHWKTLSHPRFRHHPQYQQKIYVKPSFVGPKQTTYEGNIYRLVQPLI
jgi:hypothetical protein